MNKKRNTQELLHIALTEDDEDVAREAIETLKAHHPSLDLYRQACKLQSSRNSREARVGIRLLFHMRKKRNTQELLHIALTEDDEDLAEEAIGALQLHHASRDLFEQACQFCRSNDAHERRVGADILAQLGEPCDTFHEEAVVALLSMLEQEQEPRVLLSIGSALGFRADPRAIEPLTHFKNHSESRVRFGVVSGMRGHEEELAIQTLIELSTDPDTDVRDWATFGLGSQIETDTPAIREVLFARLTDEDEETRSEAMVGLARRHDPRMVEPLLAKLKEGWYDRNLFEAAEKIGDPCLYPYLLQLQEEWEDEHNWLYRCLESAITACHASP
jgi:HEAT repeat protein